MKSESVAQIAYSGTFGNINRFPCYNPLMSAQQYNVLCGQWVGMGGDHAPDFASGAAALAYISSLDIAVGNGDIIDYGAPTYHLKRNVEGNPRQGAFFYKNFVNTAGIRGDINDNWSFDVNIQATRVDYQNEYRNDLSVTAINRGVDVVSINGVPTCVSALNGTDSSCMPYPLFNGGLPGDGGLQAVWDGGQELQNYIANATYINGNLKQTIISGYITGELGFAIPGAPANAMVVLGFENKEMSSDYRPDLPSRTGDRSGSGGATLPLAGEYDVDEMFFELSLPIRDNVSVDLGARFADYSTGADTEAFKVGAYWNINNAVALRASFQTAQRHATIGEMFSAVSDGLVDLDYDPCGMDPDTGAAPIASAAACAKTGLSSALYGTDLKSPADQYNIRGGGNPEVLPEESESMTVGLVITPDRFAGLTVTLDYFDITVEDGIGAVSAKTALDKCIETGAAGFCNLINRHPVNGTLWLSGGYISTQLTNISEESTSGIDVIFDYTRDTRFGSLTLQGVTTFLDSYEIIELPGSTPISCAGDWGGSCGKNPMPEIMGNYSATLSTDFDTDVVLGVRYLGSTDDLNANAIDFDSYTYLDLTANYYGLDNTKITLGVANVLDKEPGYTSDAGTAPGNGNTFPAYFDAFGRYIFLNLTYGVQ
jgi:outer membrane receptor protein involved in Fe transport